MNSTKQEEWEKRFDNLFGPKRDKMVGSSKARAFIHSVISEAVQAERERVINLFLECGFKDSLARWKKHDSAVKKLFTDLDKK